MTDGPFADQLMQSAQAHIALALAAVTDNPDAAVAHALIAMAQSHLAVATVRCAPAQKPESRPAWLARVMCVNCSTPRSCAGALTCKSSGIYFEAPPDA